MINIDQIQHKKELNISVNTEIQKPFGYCLFSVVKTKDKYFCLYLQTLLYGVAEMSLPMEATSPHPRQC